MLKSPVLAVSNLFFDRDIGHLTFPALEINKMTGKAGKECA
jgi:hypothetical protein